MPYRTVGRSSSSDEESISSRILEVDAPVLIGALATPEDVEEEEEVPEGSMDLFGLEYIGRQEMSGETLDIVRKLSPSLPQSGQLVIELKTEEEEDCCWSEPLLVGSRIPGGILS